MEKLLKGHQGDTLIPTDGSVKDHQLGSLELPNTLVEGVANLLSLFEWKELLTEAA